MKTFLKGTAAGIGLAIAIAAPAVAEVEFTGVVVKDKDVDIALTVDKTKTVTITSTFDADLSGAAQSNAFINATIADSTVGVADGGDTFEGDPTDFSIFRTALTTNSVIGNTGIVQYNQDAGQISNQGNVISAAAVFDPISSIVVGAEAYADQKVLNSDTTQIEPAEDVLPLLFGMDVPPHLSAVIDAGSISDNVGVIQVNQNNGSMNNQHNLLSAAVGDVAAVALSDAGLGQEISGNEVTDVNTVKEAVIVDSVNSNTGIVSVNQAVGHLNNQGTVISVAALSSAVGLGQ